MKLVRFAYEGVVYSGRFVDDTIRPAGESGLPRELTLSEVRLLPPAIPGKVVALGLNYRDHAIELGNALPAEPLIFMKPGSAVIGPGDAIILPPQSTQVDYEAELAVVIGAPARNIAAEKASDVILGYTCLNDVTARDLQRKDGQWTRAKGFDTFCPIGPWIETELNADDVEIELYLNDVLKQRSRTSNLVFGVGRLVEFITSVMTLNPGDIIATGTPSGIGPMKSGDMVEVRIEGIGSLVNRAL